MALINCPECGKEISDKATSCPSCGCPIEKKEMRNNHTEENQEQKDYTVIAAQDEKKIVESKVTRGNHTAGITAIVLGAFSLLGGIFWGGGYPLVLGGFFFLL